MADAEQAIVTEATWKPGLPPPVEALQASFPPEAGYVVEYGTWLERDEREPSGWRRIPVAFVTAPDGATATFFPRVPQSSAGRTPLSGDGAT